MQVNIWEGEAVTDVIGISMLDVYSNSLGGLSEEQLLVFITFSCHHIRDPLDYGYCFLIPATDIWEGEAVADVIGISMLDEDSNSLGGMSEEQLLICITVSSPHIRDPLDYGYCFLIPATVPKYGMGIALSQAPAWGRVSCNI